MSARDKKFEIPGARTSALRLLETADPPFWFFLREMGYTDEQLRVMHDVIGFIPILVMAVEYKGMRIMIDDAEYDEAIAIDGNVVIFRGRLGKVIHNFYQRFIRSGPAYPV